jgi:hypothetical protein
MNKMTQGTAMNVPAEKPSLLLHRVCAVGCYFSPCRWHFFAFLPSHFYSSTLLQPFFPQPSTHKEK